MTGSSPRHQLHLRLRGGFAILVIAWIWLLAAPAPSTAAAAAAAPKIPGAAWRWPLAEPVEVVRGFDPPAQRWLPGHRGVDLAAVPGDRVGAAGGGTVTFSGTIAGRGVVTVTHPGVGLRTTYEPVEPEVSAGDVVAAGAVLGRLQVDGSHCWSSCLHWGLLRGTSYLDPLLLLRPPRIRLLPHLDGAFTPPDVGAVSGAAGFATSRAADRVADSAADSAADRAYADPNGRTRTGSSPADSSARGGPRVVAVGADADDHSGDRSPFSGGPGAVAAVGGTAVAVLAGAARRRSSGGSPAHRR